MADKVTQQLWDRLMAGTSPSRLETQEPEVDATTAALLRQARGDTDYSYVHESNAEGRQGHERAVRARAREIRKGVVVGGDAEAEARRQLLQEARETREQARRRAVYEQMVKSNREEMEANSTENLQGRVRQTAKSRQEEADAALVARLQAITGAHR